VIPTPNLIPESVLARRESARWRSRWSWIIGVAALIGAAAAGMYRVGADDGLGSERADLAHVQARLGEIEGRMPGLRAEAARVKRIAGAAAVLSERPDWSLLLDALAEMCGPDIALESVKVEPLDASGQPAAPAQAAEVRVRVAGLASKQSEVQAFVLTLERSGVFDRTVPLGSGPRTIGQTEVIAFEVQCTIGVGAIAGEGS